MKKCDSIEFSLTNKLYKIAKHIIEPNTLKKHKRYYNLNSLKPNFYTKYLTNIHINYVNNII